MDLKNPKQFLVLKIISFESGWTNSLNLKRDISHWQSMCYETPLRFKILLKETFFKSRYLRVMKKHDGNALMQILQEFVTL